MRSCGRAAAAARARDSRLARSARKLSVTLTGSQEPPQPPPPPPPSSGRPPFDDVQKLREALIAFLNRDQADWDALSRDLHALAASREANSRLESLFQPPTGVGAADAAQPPPAEAIDPQEARDAWRQLADYLAHADRAQGVPHEVRKLLESDVAARAAAAAFGENLASQRDAWLDFARQIEQSRRRKRKRKP